MPEKDPLQLSETEETRIELLANQFSGPQALERTVGRGRARRISGVNFGRMALDRIKGSSEEREAQERAKAEEGITKTVDLLRETDPKNI